MPSEVYTDTVLYSTGVNVTSTWAVPSAKRLVITSLVVASYLGGTGGNVKVHGRTAFIYAFQAANQTQSFNLRMVAYQRQTVSIFTNSGDIHVWVTGFLLTDSSGATGPPGEVLRRVGPDVLPASGMVGE